MEENIRIQLVEMNRLMNYDRSKVLSEQDKKPSGPLRDVEVGKISSSIKNDPIKIKQYQSDERYNRE